MTLATLFQDVEQCLCRPSGIHFSEVEGAFIVEALVAGVKPKDIQITFDKGGLNIEAKNEGYSYSYLIPLPQGQIDESAVPEAISEEGILKVSFPKAKMARPLKIAVKNG